MVSKIRVVKNKALRETKVTVLRTIEIPIELIEPRPHPIPVTHGPSHNSKVIVVDTCQLKPPEPVHVKPYPNPIFKPIAKPITVVPAELLGPEAELQDMGWIKSGDGYNGWIKANGYLVPGRVEKWRVTQWKVFVRNPSPVIFIGRHGGCFTHTGGGWYHVHFRSCDPSDPVGLIRAIQSYFDECTKWRLPYVTS